MIMDVKMRAMTVIPRLYNFRVVLVQELNFIIVVISILVVVLLPQ